MNSVFLYNLLNIHKLLLTVSIYFLCIVITNAQKKVENKLIGVESTSNKKYQSWKDVQSCLGNNEAAIEILRITKKNVASIFGDSSNIFLLAKHSEYPLNEIPDSGSIYVAFIIKKDSDHPEYTFIENGDYLEREGYTYYSNSILNKSKDLKSYNYFWAPLKNSLKGINKVYLMGDGIYTQINVNTLLKPKSKKYLFDEIEVILIANIWEIVEYFQRIETKNTTNIYDLPNTSTDLITIDSISQKRESKMTISTLPKSLKENEEINRILFSSPNLRFILNKSNKKNSISKEITEITNIATHGFNTDLYGKSSDTLHTSNFQSERNTDSTHINLSLETNLVVLSTHESVTSKNKGDYFLLHSSGKRLVVSLWCDDEFVRSKLMITYNTLCLHKDSRIAFREAQSIIRKEHPEPYYWGAFVMIGI